MALIDSVREAPGIDIHIEELVLHGFSATARDRIAAALQRELTRLIASGGAASLSGNSIDIERLDAGSFQLDPAAPPNHIGRQLAQRVHRQLLPQLNPAKSNSVPSASTAGPALQITPNVGGHPHA